MRLFAAVLIPQGIRARLHEAAQELPKEGMRAVPQQNVHLTLKFLGEVMGGPEIEWIKERLRTIRFSPFQLGVRGVGAFPHKSRPRVIWAGAQGEGLLSLAQEVEGALLPRYPKEGRPFSAHATLARCGGRADARAFLEKYANANFGEFTVRKFSLMQSVPGGCAPAYSPVAEFLAEE